MCYNMVLILDGDSEIGSHVISNIWYLICSRHLIRSRAVANRILFLLKDLFPCAIYSELPSNRVEILLYTLWINPNGWTDPFILTKFSSVDPTVLILDGNLEHVAHALRSKKKSEILTALDLIKCLKQIK